MTTQLFTNTAAFALIAALAVAEPTHPAQTTWTSLAPDGEGFSIDVPGNPLPSSKPGHYVFEADEWSLFVQVDPVNDAVRDFVGAADRGPIRQFLDTIHKGFLRRATERSLSEADFEGYPSVRFTADGVTDDKQPIEGKYWLLVTQEHLYMLMAIGPKGASSADPDRFLGSFRLLKTTSTSSSASAPAATSSRVPLAALAAPMLAVAYMITEERLNPQVDQMMRNAPAATRLGNRWNPTLPEWETARLSFSSRIVQIAQAYQETGQIDRTFDAALARIAPGSQADAIVEALNGPAGSAIVREEASLRFIATLMADDPNGPKPGERAWTERMASLNKAFDQGIGSVMPREPAREADVTRFSSSPAGALLRSLWFAVVGKAETEIMGAARLMLFDERDTINREIEAVVTSVK